MQQASVLFAKQPKLDGNAIAESLNATYHRQHFKADPAATKPSILLRAGHAQALITPVSKPLPRNEIQALDEFAWRGWRDSGEKADSHTAHVVIKTRGTGDEKEAAALVTMVAYALCGMPNCLGVLWDSSRVIAHRNIITEQAKDVSRERPFTSLWVNGMPYKEGAATGLKTRGLAEFIGLELHFVPDPHFTDVALFQRAVDYAEFLYHNGRTAMGPGTNVAYVDDKMLRVNWVAVPATAKAPAQEWIELRW